MSKTPVEIEEECTRSKGTDINTGNRLAQLPVVPLRLERLDRFGLLAQGASGCHRHRVQLVDMGSFLALSSCTLRSTTSTYPPKGIRSLFLQRAINSMIIMIICCPGKLALRCCCQVLQMGADGSPPARAADNTGPRPVQHAATTLTRAVRPQKLVPPQLREKKCDALFAAQHTDDHYHAHQSAACQTAACSRHAPCAHWHRRENGHGDTARSPRLGVRRTLSSSASL